jgi:ArsR family transcriptional regulator
MGKDKTAYELHAEVCKSLANAKRLEIISLVCKRERHVDELAEAMGIGKANVSQHLAVLRDKGIVDARREGQYVYYRIADPKIVEACKLMRQVAMERLAGGAARAGLLEQVEDET